MKPVLWDPLVHSLYSLDQVYYFQWDCNFWEEHSNWSDLHNSFGNSLCLCQKSSSSLYELNFYLVLCWFSHLSCICSLVEVEKKIPAWVWYLIKIKCLLCLWFLLTFLKSLVLHQIHCCLPRVNLNISSDSYFRTKFRNNFFVSSPISVLDCLYLSSNTTEENFASLQNDYHE